MRSICCVSAWLRRLKSKFKRQRKSSVLSLPQTLYISVYLFAFCFVSGATCAHMSFFYIYKTTLLFRFSFPRQFSQVVVIYFCALLFPLLLIFQVKLNIAMRIHLFFYTCWSMYLCSGWVCLVVLLFIGVRFNRTRFIFSLKLMIPLDICTCLT